MAAAPDNSENDSGHDLFAKSLFAEQYDPVSVKLGTVTDVGKKRTENQDHYLVIKRRRSQEVLRTDLPMGDFESQEDVAFLLIVADGIGGSAFGELASRLVLQKIWELTTRAVCWGMRMPDNFLDQAKKRLTVYAAELQHYLTEMSGGTEFQLDLGTTATSAYIAGRDAVISHVGDSRAYLFREGQLELLTQDQTVAQLMLNAGHEPEDVEKFHRVLANYFGTGMPGTPAVAIYHRKLQDEDRLLLCTDGLSKELTDDVIRAHLAAGMGPQETCETLLLDALEHGGRDNITILIADIGS